MNVAQAVGAAVVQHAVRDVFGVVGSGNLLLANAVTAAGGRFWHARHEGGAVSMADGYARSSGRIGICTVHQGPGLTNTMTALTEAAKSCTPLLVLAADVPEEATRSNFRLDQAGLARVAGARYRRVRHASSATEEVLDALRLTVAGPVVLGLPIDVQAEACGEGPTTDIAFTRRLPAASPEDVRRIAEVLAAAERPVIIAGRGAVASEARSRIEAVGEAVGALYATSAQAKGLFADNPYDLGVSGGFASPLAARLLTEADVVVAFGASLNAWTTRRGTLIGPKARVIQVDVDPAALGRHLPVTLGCVGDAGETAGAVAAELGGMRRAGFRGEELADRICTHRWRDEPYDDASGNGRIDPRALSIALDDELPAARTVAVDSGHFMGYPAMYLSAPDPAGFVFTQAFQSVGLGLSSGIGAAVARPDRLAVAITGDGGLLMCLPELETAARLGVPVLVVIYNDAAYGAEVHHFARIGEPVELARFPDTRFAALARALGGRGCTVRSVDDLSELSDWLADPKGLFVLDAKVAPGVCAEWLEDAFRH
jgi:thiamine pyrophosphate-dependent acetolactate synthase large subunit-like protein